MYAKAVTSATTRLCRLAGHLETKVADNAVQKNMICCDESSAVKREG